MLAEGEGKRLDEYERNYIVYDLETTGTSWKKDSIIEISAVKVFDGKVAEEFSSLVNPGCPIPIYASEVNGIYDEMVENEPTLEEVMPKFLEFIGDMILVGHNIHNFDMKFLYRDCRNFYGKVPDNNYVDTLFFSRKKLPDLAHHRLVDLSTHYGISTEGAHRALNDCRMNQQVYEFLLKEEDKNYTAIKCPKCGNLLKIRNGKFGEFRGCSKFPACRYTENI